MSTPQRPSKPPPAGPAPPAPGAAPPNPPQANGGSGGGGGQAATPTTTTANGTKATPTVNGATSKAKKGSAKADTPVDPAAMYESLKNKIAALEEELNHQDEEELKFSESFIFSCICLVTFS